MTRHFCDACGAETDSCLNLTIQCKVQSAGIYHTYTVCSWTCAKMKTAECMNLAEETQHDT